MKFDIDVAFLAKDRTVRKVRHAMPRRRIAMDLLAHSVLELPPGTLRATRTEPGDRLEFEKYAVE
jgi:uncharacterized membrane protein (UPF0127 family)